jgi:hypothetical protein
MTKIMEATMKIKDGSSVDTKIQTGVIDVDSQTLGMCYTPNFHGDGDGRYL